jgi:hypothetical protein
MLPVNFRVIIHRARLYIVSPQKSSSRFCKPTNREREISSMRVALIVLTIISVQANGGPTLDKDDANVVGRVLSNRLSSSLKFPFASRLLFTLLMPLASLK